MAPGLSLFRGVAHRWRGATAGLCLALCWAALTLGGAWAQEGGAAAQVGAPEAEAGVAGADTEGAGDLKDPWAGRTLGSAGVVVVRLENGPIVTATERYIMARLDRAEAEELPFVLVLDTPGGAVDTTRAIVRRFLGATVPVLVWVGPPGARAGSAGVFITMSAHVAGMAPGTNIGAAHPIGAGVGAPRREGEEESARRSEEEVMAEKIENDLVAFAEAIATTRGRNVEWAISAVKDSASVPAERALELGVVDLISPDLKSFLKDVDGREVKTEGGMVRLATADSELIEAPMTLRERVQLTLGDPSIAYLLMSLGVMGIVLELYNPGMMIGGIVGGICLVLAAASGLPFNLGGVLLLAAAGVLFVLEVYVTSFGLLSLAGSICLVLGGIFLFEAPPDLPDGAGFGVAVGMEALVSVGLLSLAIALSLAYLIGRAHVKPVEGGENAVLHQRGKAMTHFARGEGKVFVNGEYWTARSAAPIRAGDAVRVEGVEGLVLRVRPEGDDPPPPPAAA